MDESDTVTSLPSYLLSSGGPHLPTSEHTQHQEVTQTAPRSPNLDLASFYASPSFCDHPIWNPPCDGCATTSHINNSRASHPDMEESRGITTRDCDESHSDGATVRINQPSVDGDALLRRSRPPGLITWMPPYQPTFQASSLEKCQHPMAKPSPQDHQYRQPTESREFGVRLVSPKRSCSEQLSSCQLPTPRPQHAQLSLRQTNAQYSPQQRPSQGHRARQVSDEPSSTHFTHSSSLEAPSTLCPTTSHIAACPEAHHEANTRSSRQTPKRHHSYVGMEGFPTPFAECKSREKFTAEHDELMIYLKEERHLSWRQISEFFPGRAMGTIQVRYNTKLSPIVRSTQLLPHVRRRLFKLYDERMKDLWEDLANDLAKDGWGPEQMKEYFRADREKSTLPKDR